ncbi:MAG: phosphodiester glycosidase family protein [Oscillospiraceae bacterium]|nr:phosphodiester glycosidase family protein [Oscillospiraceae bacterium]
MDTVVRTINRTNKPRLYKKKKYTWAYALVIAVLLVAALYITFVFSPNPFITRWREIWITTAMSTWKHQWLATRFIPGDIIDDVMSRLEAAEKANETEDSQKPPESLGDDITIPSQTVPDPEPQLPEPSQPDPGQSSAPVVVPPKEENIFDRADVKSFLSIYYQIDKNTLPEDFKNWKLDKLQKKNISSLGIKTTAGDPVWAIDTVNGILIVEVSGKNEDGLPFSGYLAIVKDSSQVFMAMSTSPDVGLIGANMNKRYDGILCINANPFIDPDGKGRGGYEDVMGLAISQGKVWHEQYGQESFQLGGFDRENNFLVGTKLDITTLRDAGEFKPVIVKEGKSRVANASFGTSMQPRSCIGQTNKRETLLMVIDGRGKNGSSGCTVRDEAKILLKYNAWNVLGNDGGSSAVMVYDGEVISHPSSVSANGRNLPNAWVVKKR